MSFFRLVLHPKRSLTKLAVLEGGNRRETRKQKQAAQTEAKGKLIDNDAVKISPHIVLCVKRKCVRATSGGDGGATILTRDHMGFLDKYSKRLEAEEQLRTGTREWNPINLQQSPTAPAAPTVTEQR